MPLYEYVCEEDGTVIELMRPADQADDPVPDERGRTFRRRLSVFAPHPGGGATEAPWCPCGKQRGSCGGSER